MKLNLGCGDRYAEGWHNVDWAGSPHRKDEAVDLTGELPWTAQKWDLVYAGHVLEHLTIDQCQDLLDRLLCCMMDHGKLMVVGPDIDRAQEMAIAGTLDVTMDSLKFGAHRWPGDEHQWECTPGVIEELLTSTGWRSVKEVGIENVGLIWPIADRGPTWQCAVEAFR